MQIRRRHNKAQLLRYRYDPERKRSRQELVGTVDWYSPGLDAQTTAKLSAAELQQFEEFAALQRITMQHAHASYALDHLLEGLRAATTAVERGVTPPRLRRLEPAWRALRRAILKRKPRK